MNLGEGLALSLTGSQNAFKKPGSPQTPPPVDNSGFGYSQANPYGISPGDYKGTFGSAYENLGQPGSALDPRVVNSGTFTLSNAFVDAFHGKTGRLPSPEQVRDFVAQNLTPGFAQKMITGQINQDQIVSNYVNPYIQGNPDLLTDPSAAANAQASAQSAEEKRILGLNTQLDEVYNRSKDLATQSNEDIYGKAKQGLVSDLASQGLLSQANSRYSLNDLEGEKNKSLTNTMNTLAADRASGAVDLGKTVENLLAGERRAKESTTQFNQNLGLANRAFNANRDDVSFNQGLQNRSLGMAGLLGQYQANANKPKVGSSILGGVTGGAATGAAFGPWGAGIGAGLGGLAGYLSTLG